MERGRLWRDTSDRGEEGREMTQERHIDGGKKERGGVTNRTGKKIVSMYV